jgi:hypothetical protein
MYFSQSCPRTYALFCYPLRSVARMYLTIAHAHVRSFVPIPFAQE